MVNRDLPASEEELHAYVDGQLPADRVAAVEARLASHAEDMARVADWRSQAEAIRARYATVAEQPVPPHLSLDRLVRPRRRAPVAAIAASIAAFLVGGAGGWVAHGTTTAPRSAFDLLTGNAVDAYKVYVAEVRHPVEVPGSEEKHLVQWLSKRVGYDLRCPNLEKVGLKLVGGRLLPGQRGAAAFFMYETASGERYTLYTTQSPTPDTALRYNAIGRVASLAWVDGDVAYVISGEANRERLRRVAEAAYDELSTRKPAGNDGS